MQQQGLSCPKARAKAALEDGLTIKCATSRAKLLDDLLTLNTLLWPWIPQIKYDMCHNT